MKRWVTAFFILCILLGFSLFLWNKSRPPELDPDRLASLHKPVAENPIVTAAFPEHLEANLNGQKVLSLLHTTRNAKDFQSLIGKPVAFFGEHARSREFCDLVVDGGFLLDVQLVPPDRPPPLGVSWDAWVLGVLKKVDAERKIIRVEASPDNWILGSVS